MSIRVAIVIVSHSDLLARGVIEVASQMAPDVIFQPAGGAHGHQLGTSFDLIQEKIEIARRSVSAEVEGSGVLILTDLGSATMTVQAVLDMDDNPENLVFVDTPLVEGAVAAAISAQQGHSIDLVRQNTQKVGAIFCYGDPGSASTTIHDFHLNTEEQMSDTHSDHEATQDEPQTFTVTAVVADPVGLHARPAALLARRADGFDAQIEINGADATSALEIMSLGISLGDQVTFVASGPEAETALNILKEMVETAPEQ